MPNKSLDALFEGYPDEVGGLARSARAFIYETVPDVQETVDASAPVVSYGYGTGYKGMICTLILSKTGVKLGVVYGATLPDPKHLLEGPGKVHRYVSLRTAADLRRPGLGALLRSSRQAARARLG
jgi:hypothetical protein